MIWDAEKAEQEALRTLQFTCQQYDKQCLSPRTILSSAV